METSQQPPSTAGRKRNGRPRLAALGTLLLVGVITVASPAPLASAAPGDGTGCGYGTGGPFADTLCWIDMSGYNDATARSVDGQLLSATLPGGYTVEFTVRTSGTRGIVPSVFPTWDFGAAVGKYIYLSTPGQPALYQTTGQGAAGTTIALTNISVTDSGDNPVRGWRFVGVDAEATADSESITFSSNVPVSTLATYVPAGATNGCQVNVQQIDANTVNCTGTNVGSVYGTVLVGATEPSTFTQTMTVGNGASREGVAFAFQSSTISLDVAVADRADADDSFGVEVVSPESAVVGAATTGADGAAGTGDLVVLPRVDGSSYALSVTAGTGTDLASYDASWSCTRDGEPDASLGAAGGATIDVSPDAGERIACTVALATVSAPPSSTTTTTTNDPGATTSTTVAATGTTSTTIGTSGTLPATGSDGARPLALVGLALVAGGGLLLVLLRRRTIATTP